MVLRWGHTLQYSHNRLFADMGTSVGFIIVETEAFGSVLPLFKRGQMSERAFGWWSVRG